MAEPAKKSEPKSVNDGLTRISVLQLKEALDLHPIGSQKRLTLQRDPHRPGIGPVPVLDMTWDKAGEVVVVEFVHMQKTSTHIVPLGNIAGMTVAE